MRTAHLVAVLAGALALAAPAQAATAGQAARVTAKCFRDKGWKATVNGRTVKATSPRIRPRNSFPRRPFFQVQFNEIGNGRFLTVQVRHALNARETLTAKHCVNQGKRA